jgi:xylan 1,4-beta-xylosidase
MAGGSMMEYILDVRGEKAPLKKYWELCVGSCHAPTALRSDWQEMLRQCRKDIGFRYVRFHGLFDDDMSVALKPLLADKPVLSFVNIDKIYDYLLSIGMKPFVEIGFMPECFASGDQTIFEYRGNVTPPKDYDQWAWFIGEFAGHLVNRYGLDEVRQWFFEVWNEPNLGGPNSLGFWIGDQAEYFKLYKTTAQALKKVDPRLKVGGPATSNNAWIPDFVNFCKASGTPVDFITTHHYPTDIIVGFGVEDRLTLKNPMLELYTTPGKAEELERDPKEKEEFLKEQERFQERLWEQIDRGVLETMTRRVVQEAAGLPVYYTEWNSMAGLESDGPFGASFIVKTVLDGRDLTEGYSYWTFCDIFEEQGQRSQAFSGEFGLLTQHGIAKASYRVFQLLHRLGGQIYTQKFSHGTLDVYAVEKSEAGVLQLVLVNHNSLRHPIREETLEVKISGGGRCIKAEIERVDGEHGNALAAWERMGSPEYLSEEQVLFLRASSVVVKEELRFEDKGGELRLKTAIPPMGTALVTIYWG